MTGFILCADDFGITKGVSRGILDLAVNGRITAVSCIVEGKAFREFAPILNSLRNIVDIGLHITLTDQETQFNLPIIAPSGRYPSFTKLLSWILYKKEISTDIENAVKKQFHLFREVFDFFPDFVDGHQHVQNFTIVGNYILMIVKKNKQTENIYIRNTKENFNLILKRKVALSKTLFLNAISDSIRKECYNSGIKTNRGFSGVYNFSTTVAYSELFYNFLNGIKHNSIIMCHPGKVDNDLRSIDSLTEKREFELEYFSSNHFLDLLNERNIRLKRFMDS